MKFKKPVAIVIKEIQSGIKPALGMFWEVENGEFKFLCPDCCIKILEECFPELKKSSERFMLDEKFEEEAKKIWIDAYEPFEIPPQYKDLFLQKKGGRSDFFCLKFNAKITCEECKAVIG